MQTLADTDIHHRVRHNSKNNSCAFYNRSTYATQVNFEKVNDVSGPPSPGRARRDYAVALRRTYSDLNPLAVSSQLCRRAQRNDMVG